MAETTFTAYEALEIALEMEDDGIVFYEAMAQAAPQPELQELARQLADAERDHKRRIREMIDAEDYANGWSNEDLLMLDQYVRENLKRDIFPGRAAAEKLSDRLANLFDGFTLAIGFERQTVDYYQKLHETCTYPTGKEAFGQLVEEEKRHEALLMEARGKIE
ncbi:MAG: hypothetical protein GF330_13565 [Candidatus Eisenbacteria bacterium]|nr:hypothetical protein [Candidatus Eisenbacteria bacterium]